ncbi:hypothetical protein FOL47_009064 [Perkinsus chesapeaki]|uniref:Uncharacterized protein n=1 Tax=Perkinsus chesapeaki TaxID=330153 RepID=A0A7J6MSE9_PERCH|nr:hypothetical protein FOL47_009064 [Perkinsus chesapeaki]
MAPPIYPLTSIEAAAGLLNDTRQLAKEGEENNKCGDHGKVNNDGICECDAKWYHIQIDDGSVLWCAYNNRAAPPIPGYYWVEDGLNPGEYELFPNSDHLEILDMRFWIFALLIFECCLLICCRFIRDRFCGPSVEEVIARLPPGCKQLASFGISPCRWNQGPPTELTEEEYAKVEKALEEGRYPCNSGSFNLTIGRCVCYSGYVHLVYEDRIEMCNYKERIAGAPSAPGFHFVGDTLRRGTLTTDAEALDRSYNPVVWILLIFGIEILLFFLLKFAKKRCIRFVSSKNSSFLSMSYPDSTVLLKEKFYWVKTEDRDPLDVLLGSLWGFIGFFLFVQACCFLSFKVLRFVFRPDKMKDLPPRRPLTVKLPKLPSLSSSKKDDRSPEGYGPNPYTPSLTYGGPPANTFGAPSHPMAHTYGGPSPHTPSHSFIGSSPYYPTYAQTAGPSYPMVQSQPQLPVGPMYQSPYGQTSPYPMEMSPQQHFGTAQQLPTYSGQSMMATTPNLSPGYGHPSMGTYTQPPGYGSPGAWGTGTPQTMRCIPTQERSQSHVGLGVQCNSGREGIQAISIATIGDGVFIYIIKRNWLPRGLRDLLRNPSCTKFVCNINDYLRQRVRECFRLRDFEEGVVDIGDASVQSAGRTMGLRVFWPRSPSFHVYSTPLDWGHQGYLAMTCFVPLMAASQSSQKHAYKLMQSFLVKYDVNERSRTAWFNAQRNARRSVTAIDSDSVNEAEACNEPQSGKESAEDSDAEVREDDSQSVDESEEASDAEVREDDSQSVDESEEASDAEVCEDDSQSVDESEEASDADESEKESANPSCSIRSAASKRRRLWIKYSLGL